nr:MAG: DNA pilot protein [Microvirus sp.]
MGFFDGIVSAITSPVASLVGGLAGGIGQSQTNQKNWDIAQSQNATNEAMQVSAQNFNSDQAIQDRSFQADQAQKGRDYATNMSNTSYQRAVGDLQAAGLNPMLAYSNGGASTPNAPTASGAHASISPNRAASVAPMGNTAAAVMSGAAQAAQTMNTIKQNELIAAQTHQTDTQSDNIQADTANKLDDNPYIRQKYGNILADTLVKQSMARLNSASEAATRQEMTIKTPEQLKAQGKWGTFVSPYLKDLNSATSAITRLGK